MEAQGIGRIDGTMFVRKEDKSHLEDVWFVTEVGRNWFSVSSTLNKGNISGFDRKRSVL